MPPAASFVTNFFLGRFYLMGSRSLTEFVVAVAAVAVAVSRTASALFANMRRSWDLLAMGVTRCAVRLNNSHSGQVNAPHGNARLGQDQHRAYGQSQPKRPHSHRLLYVRFLPDEAFLWQNNFTQNSQKHPSDMPKISLNFLTPLRSDAPRR
jgi:hypothetical protein